MSGSEGRAGMRWRKRKRKRENGGGVGWGGASCVKKW